jgi:tetratricopeptide (TPR) repeat protein
VKNATVLLTVMAIAATTLSCRRAEVASTVPLFNDLGTHHHAITTSNAEAQRYFDQGLRLVFGFNHDEAERAFREAARLDPSSAMAWWGVALALGPNINLPLDDARNARALAAVHRAEAQASAASEIERRYIEAIAVRYSSDPTSKRDELDDKYSRAMRALSTRYPADDDAAVLFAESMMDLKPWQLWTADGQPQEGTPEILRTLETVLARSPNHPGANHYYIHAIEASPDPAKAKASAERLKTLVPGAGHLVHMPAHIQMRTGDYQGAADANTTAVVADEKYLARTGATGAYPMMYYTHNFQFLAAAAATIGQCRAAVEAGDRAADVAHMAGHDVMAEYVLPTPICARARCGQWDAILALAKPADTTPVTLAFWLYARGLAHLAKGDSAAARADRHQFGVLAKTVPADTMLNLNSARSLLAIAGDVLDGRLATSAGDHATAVAAFQRAVATQDSLRYDEPPAWYFPVRESLGGALMRAKRFAEAERVFERDLALNAENPRSLFGLREARRALAKPFDDIARRFDALWQRAEIALSLAEL